MFLNIYILNLLFFSIFIAYSNCNSSIVSIIPPDPSEIDPIWEATIRNVLLNTTIFKPSKVKVLIQNYKYDEENNDEENIEIINDNNDNDNDDNDNINDNINDSSVSTEISNKQENNIISVMSESIKQENIAENFNKDQQTRQRERALRTWFETSLLDISKKSKIPLSHQEQSLIRWSRLYELLTSEIASLARAITPTITESLYTSNVSSECSRDFLRLVTAVRNNQDWAWRILDSNGRLPIGLISGNSFAFGDYDQCLDSDSLSQNSISSRYCLLHLSIPVSKPKSLRMHYKDSPNELYRLLEQNQDSGFDPSMRRYLKRIYQAMFSTSILNGICVPSTCSEEDIYNFILSFDTFKNESTTFAGEISISDCTKIHGDINFKENSTKNQNSFYQKFKKVLKSLSIHETISLVTIFILFILPLIGWILNRFLSNQQNIAYEWFLKHFSPINNFHRLITISELQKTSKIQFLNVVRLVSTLWIVITHCATLGAFFAPSIVYRFEAEARIFAFSPIGQLFYNAYASVEIFFFLSGFFLIKSITSQKIFPGFFHYVFYRFIRLIPPVIALISLFFFWPFIGSGPVFGLYSKNLIDACNQNWWKSIFLMNNHDKSDDICLIHTWFLSADFQLHILAYPILLLIRKRQIVRARLMIIFLICLEFFWFILKLNSRNVPASMNVLFQIVPQEFYIDMQELYYPTQNHFTSYFVGIATSYYLYRKGNTGAYKSHFLLIAPALGLASLLFPIYWTMQDTTSDVQTIIGFIYLIFSRLIHSISIGCLCLWALPRTLKFSSSILIILSRLSYSIYLIHLPIIWYFLFTTRQPIRLEFVSVLFFSGGILFFTLPIALIFHLFFEAPYSTLCTELMHKFYKSKLLNHSNDFDEKQDYSNKCVEKEYNCEEIKERIWTVSVKNSNETKL